MVTDPETPLARVMKDQGRKRAWLAGEMGVSYWRVTRLLAGEVEMTLGEASRAASVLGVSIETFLPGEAGGALPTGRASDGGSDAAAGSEAE